MNRTEFLRKNARDIVQKNARVAMPECWDTIEQEGTIAERKAKAMAYLFDNMPIYIGEQELIVGSRTMYGHRDEFLDKSDMNVVVMPHYLSEVDKEEFGGVNGEFYSITHYTPNFGRILNLGIDGVIKTAEEAMAKQNSQLKKGWLNAVIISYQSISRWITRYADYAAEMAENSCGERKNELLKIADTCRHVAHNTPRDFYEAVQLFWFESLATIVENFRWINYGRVDQFLYPWYNTVSAEEAQQLVDCLLCKMYDGADIKSEYFSSQQEGQLNITIGGVTRDGKNAVNELTFAFVTAVGRTRFPEPEVSCRISSLNPPEYLRKCAELSISGLNCMAYYNDDQFVKSMAAAGIPVEDARDYAFDLCQDMNIPGRGDFYVSASVDMAETLLKTMHRVSDDISFDGLMAAYKEDVAAVIKERIEEYNLKEKAIREYVDGNPEFLREQIKSGALGGYSAAALMSPLPITSALYDNCLESAEDLSWYGTVLPDKGCMVAQPVVAVNSLAALHKRVFDEKRFTLSEVTKACDDNFDGYEKMRQLLWTAPKWANDDDYVDLPAKEILEFACDEFLKYRTPTGGRHLAGIHQPHPVSSGWYLSATPEGRKSGEPIPVTLSPENGTMLNGPTAAFCSAAKIDPMKYQWNFCVMLQYFSSVFEANEGADLFASMLNEYFSLGGGQHQPNIVNVQDLKNAQLHPEDYKDLIVRMWGVSANFVNLTKEVQDEFIARFENL